jgi:predicted nucleic acid-binding protein
VLASIGDRLGLFADLAAYGPSSSDELSSLTGTDERYVREWLSADLPRHEGCRRRRASPNVVRAHRRAQESGVADLLNAAAAELAQLTVLHLDQDYELIADITGQPVERLRLR